MGKIKVTSYDGHFLERLRTGNKDAIKQACSIAMGEFSDIDDEVMNYIRCALQKIVEGCSPDKAFGYRGSKAGRKKSSNGFRNMVIVDEVQRIRDAGYSKADAIAAVSAITKPDLGLDYDAIEKICKQSAEMLRRRMNQSISEKATINLPFNMPDEIFPISKETLEIMNSMFPIPDHSLPEKGKK